ncbi:MAG: Hsp20/alpha crystallin family protein [Nitrospirae bacterium YQR-1]
MELKDLIPWWNKGSNLAIRREEEPGWATLHRNINELFDNFLDTAGFGPFGGFGGRFSPRIDVMEGDKDIRITTELPGMDEKDIDVSLRKDSLIIRGEKKDEKETKGSNYYRMERSYGSFSRCVALPAEVETDKVEAVFKNGVLTITMPKTEEAIKETKRIAVKAA